MKRNIWLVLSSICFLMAALLFSAAGRSRDEQLAAQIAPGILRFHILADSNRREDQELKLQVRSLLLDQINKGIAALEEGSSDSAEAVESGPTGLSDFSPAEPSDSGAGKAAVIRYIEENAPALERSAEEFLLASGKSCPVKIEVAEDYFPTKYYGDIRLPCGVYQAARVTIGKGEGHNWWCVLYPRLCFVDESLAVMPQDSKEKLRRSLPEEACRTVLRPQRKISRKLSELFS